jgi:hypothetical protein
VDIILRDEPDIDTGVAMLIQQLCATVSAESIPTANAGGFVDFQLSRGLLGVST